jgi:hypothetical protein
MKPTPEVQAALVHVRQHFPEVTTVFYGCDGRWLFTSDDAAESPSFEGVDIDVGLLEDAADSVDELPAAFRVEGA